MENATTMLTHTGYDNEISKLLEIDEKREGFIYGAAIGKKVR